MSVYDEMKGNLQALYDAALEELKAIEEKRARVLKDIEYLSPLCGDRHDISDSKKYDLSTLKSVEGTPRRHMRQNKFNRVPDRAERLAGEKKIRVKEEDLRVAIMESLEAVYPNSLSAAEIFDKLKSLNLPDTQSFRTRVYGKLGEWTKGGILDRPERGVYRLMKNINE